MQLSYLEFGEKGKTIVFLHGWQQDKKSLSSLAPYLYQEYRLFFLDLPGFGQSDRPKDNFTSFDYADAVKSWINQKKLKNINLAGHSFGGKIAAIISAQNPKLVSKLILMACSGVVSPPKQPPLRKFIPKPLVKLGRPLYIKLFASRDYKQAANLLPIFKSVVKEDLTEIFRQINIPTLILWGKEDEELPFSNGQKINNLIKGSFFSLVSGSHFFFQQQPQETASLISKFIEDGKI